MPTITLPTPSLVLLLGVSGSGKSTLAQKHFQPTEIVSSDRVRALICDDEKKQSINSAAFGLLHQLTRLRLQHHRLTVIDATNLQYRARRPLLRLARAARVPIVAIVLNISLEKCRKQNQLRTTRVVPNDIIDQQYTELATARARLSMEGYAFIVELDEADLENFAIERAPAPAHKAEGSEDYFIEDKILSGS